MLISTLKALFKRDLEKLKEEILLYKNEKNIWLTDKAILNSAGNLCLHLTGNLNAYIGAEFGNTGYIRNRPEEFSLKDVPKKELIDKIEQTIQIVENTLDIITESQLQAEYPQETSLGKVSTGYFFIHLAMHLSYHLGQVNYHRRLLDN